MEPVKRKPNRLAGWDYSQNGVYFITICAKDGASILGKVVRDGVLDVPSVQLTNLGQAVHNRIVEIDACYPNISVLKFCIMPNHLHLLVAVENGTSGTPSRTNQTIPAFVSTLKRYVNRAFGRQLWHRSYHDHIVRNDADFRRIWDYIDTNPSKWAEDCYYKRGTD